MKSSCISSHCSVLSRGIDDMDFWISDLENQLANDDVGKVRIY